MRLARMRVPLGIAVAGIGWSAADPPASVLRVDRATRTVHLRLVAAARGSGMLLNFNGGTDGRHTVTVPRGWTVRATVINQDPEVQHSAIVITQDGAMPATPRVPVFAGARTRHLMPGIPKGGQDTLSFIAGRAGRYRIACGMTAHAQAGMWIALVVTGPGGKPEYERR